MNGQYPKGSAIAASIGYNSKTEEEGIMRFDSSLYDSIHNGTILGKSGTQRSFDLVLQKRERTEGPITIYYLKANFDRNNLINFFKNSVDVGAIKYILVTKQPLQPDEIVFCKNLGIEISKSIIMTRTGESKESVQSRPDGTTAQPKLDRSVQKKRERTTIMKDILQLARYYDNVGITKIIYKCNLNYISAKKLLEDMIERDLIEMVESESSRKNYKITDNGENLLKKILSLRELGGDY